MPKVQIVQSVQTKQTMQSKPTQGFTLIEILIVVAILGVLASIALPAYQNSVLRSGRAEAKGELLIVASDQERFFSSNNAYVVDATPLNTTDGTTRTTETGLYSITIAACGAGIATCFTATATPQGNQVNDACTTLTIDSIGVRGATGDTVDECWNR